MKCVCVQQCICTVAFISFTYTFLSVHHYDSDVISILAYCSLQSTVWFGNFITSGHECRDIDSMGWELWRFFCQSPALIYRCHENHTGRYALSTGDSISLSLSNRFNFVESLLFCAVVFNLYLSAESNLLQSCICWSHLLHWIINLSCMVQIVKSCVSALFSHCSKALCTRLFLSGRRLSRRLTCNIIPWIPRTLSVTML